MPYPHLVDFILRDDVDQDIDVTKYKRKNVLRFFYFEIKNAPFNVPAITVYRKRVVLMFAQNNG